MFERRISGVADAGTQTNVSHWCVSIDCVGILVSQPAHPVFIDPAEKMEVTESMLHLGTVQEVC